MNDPTEGDPPVASSADASRREILSYAAQAPGGMVTVGKYSSEAEAGLPAAELDGEGIPCQVCNTNVNGLGFLYRGLSSVELQVRASDAPRALEILGRVNADDLEPLDEARQPHPLGEDGLPLKLEIAGSFETVRGMREAQTMLASSRIRSFAPALARRGNQVPGRGARFILRVEEDAAQRARSLLEEASTESDEDDQRCPRCGSWRLYPVTQFFKSIAALCGGPRVEPRLECLGCRYRGPATEFGARVARPDSGTDT